MAANTQDYGKMMQDMMGAFPMDMSAMQDSFRTAAGYGEKMSKVALEAAEKSTEISSKWTKDMLHKLGDVSTAREEPSSFAQAMTDFASAQAEMTAEAMAQFAEVAKRVQMETVEIMLAAGKDMSEDMTAAAKKATEDMTAATKQASADASSATKQTTRKTSAAAR